jgi:hypothetical protein
MKRKVIKTLVGVCGAIALCCVLFLVISYAYANIPKPNHTAVTTHSPLKAWNFYVDENKKWEWNNVKTSDGEIIKASTKGFDTEKACVEDAKSSGYSE